MTTEERLLVKTKEDHLLNILLTRLRRFLGEEEQSAIRAIQNYELVKKHRQIMNRNAGYGMTAECCVPCAIEYICESRMCKEFETKMMFLEFSEKEIRSAIKQLL